MQITEEHVVLCSQGIFVYQEQMFQQSHQDDPNWGVHLQETDIRNMHAFGSTCFAYVQVKKKLDQRSEEGIFVGYDTNSSAYLVCFPHHNDVQRVRYVKF